jgi:hypothetical protein
VRTQRACAEKEKLAGRTAGAGRRRTTAGVTGRVAGLAGTGYGVEEGPLHATAAVCSIGGVAGQATRGTGQTSRSGVVERVGIEAGRAGAILAARRARRYLPIDDLCRIRPIVLGIKDSLLSIDLPCIHDPLTAIIRSVDQNRLAQNIGLPLGRLPQLRPNPLAIRLRRKIALKSIDSNRVVIEIVHRLLGWISSIQIDDIHKFITHVDDRVCRILQLVSWEGYVVESWTVYEEHIYSGDRGG